ncbi:Glycosyl transferase, group 1 [Salipiger mucosus DSM 16094]|uniref:Glycosyl transferase, group 1 n=1 Tax=Salipiger mucosus DSM 16094 TaxID=1123237 RepID=S9S7W9_9RHOB|nr:Glycosyl transferase, group 1 [Salipiger mucosus DSM 16094]
MEYAYLSRLLAEDVPLFGLVRSTLGFILLDAAGCADFRRRLDAQDWAPPDRLSRLRRGTDPTRARAEAGLRRVALARTLKAQLPEGIAYINTGHTNLTDRTVAALKGIPGARISVLLHDTIPLDFPEYAAEGVPERFRAFLELAGAEASLLICNSHVTEADVQRLLAPQGLHPETVVAPLGLDRPQPGRAPRGPWTGKPFFVVLGTIEPRKNHALLLDIWERERPEAHLLICGTRGWNNADVFARLDRGIPGVHERPGCSDAEVFALLADSAGLLFPSHAEGYGLPPLEAAALGVPVVASDLPVVHETLGDIPVYAAVTDRYRWIETIKRLTEEHRAAPDTRDDRAGGFAPPTWDSHFKTVLTLT